MSAALLKINKSVCHLCAALDRHTTVHLGPSAKNIGSWILKSRLANYETNKQTRQGKKKLWFFFHRSSSQIGVFSPIEKHPLLMERRSD